MKKRPSAPLRSCSTVNSRRIKAPRLILACGLLLAPLPLSAQPASGGRLSASLVAEKNRVFLRAAFALDSVRDVLEPIESGLKSRVVFTIQLVKPRTGLLSFLGDDVLLEKTVSFVGSEDFYENVFVLEDEAGRKKTFAREEDFAAAFATLARYPLDEFLRARDGERCFLRLRVKVYPVRLVAPLTLIYLLSSSGVIESDWVRVELP